MLAPNFPFSRVYQIFWQSSVTLNRAMNWIPREVSKSDSKCFTYQNSFSTYSTEFTFIQLLHWRLVHIFPCSKYFQCSSGWKVNLFSFVLYFGSMNIPRPKMFPLVASPFHTTLIPVSDQISQFLTEKSQIGTGVPPPSLHLWTLWLI